MPIEAFKEHLTLLKTRGVQHLSIPPEKGQLLRAILTATGKEPAPTVTITKVSVSARGTGPEAPSFTPKSFIAEPLKTFQETSAISSMPKTSTSEKIDVSKIPALSLPKDISAADKKTQWEWLKNHVITNPTVLKHVREGVVPVFGVGNIDSPIFFCGEAPGAEEEQKGEPFVGRAGQLLTKIIQAMGFERKDVYIANILNWRPEKDDMTAGNRPPTIEEMSQCIPFLKAQVNIVQPKVIVALGATAVTGLLGADPERRMGDVRGKFHTFNDTPVMITYHPSYLLRNNTNAAKRVVWEDIILVMKKVGMKITPAQEKFFT